MGNQCCSSSTVEDEVSCEAGQLAKGQLTRRQVQMIVRIQSVFRGFMARKRVYDLKVNMMAPGMSSFKFDPS